MFLDNDNPVEVAKPESGVVPDAFPPATAAMTVPVPVWLRSGGAMGAHIASSFEQSSPLGPLQDWPGVLQSTLQWCLESRLPLAVVWGRDGFQLYNDAFLAICGTKHPGALGQRFRDCWASAWATWGPFYQRAWAGQASYVEDGRLFLDRTGGLEETFLTFAFSPVRDLQGRVVGVTLAVVETTAKMLTERRTRLLRDIATATTGSVGVRAALERAIAVLHHATFDVPFALAYAIEPGATEAELVAATASTPEFAAPLRVALTADALPWPLARAVKSRRPELVTGQNSGFGASTRAYPESPATVLLLPLVLVGSTVPAAVLVAAVSARLRLDDDYLLFFERLAAAVATAVGSARAHEEQRQRAEQLSALDHAKTAFFSNVSHEFRTPLTLLAGPLADELAELDSPLTGARRTRLETAHRNAQRLIKLVDALLDFSRLEAGKASVRSQPTRLGVLTTELASMFRSAIERAGLWLRVEVEPSPDVTFVDRDMWEKIVLNLLSNAFKHTFTGGITVRLRHLPQTVELDVADTGVGIAEEEQQHLFERFQRVAGAPSRTHEGTGIGLSLVRELAQLHGGDVRLASQLGQGTTFTVVLPRGNTRLPATNLEQDAPTPPGSGVAACVQEALEWATDTSELQPAAVEAPGTDQRATILLADDNADMRAYVAGLLSSSYRLVAVADGQAALDLLPNLRPDLVLSDVMMPRLDGLGLLRAIRENPRTRTLPVVLLSARAGEEPALAGLETGADDYLIKPFAARELLARVRTHLELSRMRRERAEQLELVNQELEAFSYSVSHDLRAPLRAIDGFSKALLAHKSDQLDEEGKQFLARVRNAVGRMAELIDDLLNLSRVSRAPLQREATSLTALSRAVAAALAERRPEHVDFQVEEGLAVDADPHLLRIVLENLLENSWKFSRLRSDARVCVGQVAGADPATYFVRDNGAGFDPSYAHRLFQPFERLHHERDFPGTGIGLAIVHRVVTRHGGRIWAEGREGEGACFYFTFSEPA